MHDTLNQENESNMISQPNQGVIVGVNSNQEWLLPWWLMNFQVHNVLPITFINFGDMTEKAIEWCRLRGNLIDLKMEENLIAPKESVDVDLATMWESMHPEVWKMREGWFKKPFAMLLSPYERTIWLDVDCQVRGSIETIFSQCENDAGICLAPEADYSQVINFNRKMILPGQLMLNSGVVVYKRGSKAIQEWAHQVHENTHLHFGDQQLLVNILYTHGMGFTYLSREYNWIAESGANPDAVIFHWSGRYKDYVKLQIESMYKVFGINLFLM